MGLWTVAGSWSADELTDGWVPDDVIDYLAPGIGNELATRLERAGLWRRVTRDGEEGWQFHEWTDHQPTREQVLAERAAAALRQKRARDKAREKRDKTGQDDEPSRRDSRVTHTATHGDVTPVVTVPPTRPDPTKEVLPPTEVATPQFGTAEADQLFVVEAASKKPPKPRATTENPNAQAVVAAFVDGAKEKGRTVTTTVIKQVGATAKQLLDRGEVPHDQLVTAAREMGRKGWKDLNMQLLRGEEHTNPGSYQAQRVNGEPGSITESWNRRRARAQQQ